MKFFILTYFLIFTSLSVNVLALETAPRISDREIIESLATLKEGQKTINQRFDAVNQRFDAANQRFDDLKWFLGTMIGVLMLINCSVLGYVLKQQGALSKSLESMRDQMNFLKSVIEKSLTPKEIL